MIFHNLGSRVVGFPSASVSVMWRQNVTIQRQKERFRRVLPCGGWVVFWRDSEKAKIAPFNWPDTHRGAHTQLKCSSQTREKFHETPVTSCYTRSPYSQALIISKL